MCGLIDQYGRFVTYSTSLNEQSKYFDNFLVIKIVLFLANIFDFRKKNIKILFQIILKKNSNNILTLLL